MRIASPEAFGGREVPLISRNFVKTEFEKSSIDLDGFHQVGLSHVSSKLETYVATEISGALLPGVLPVKVIWKPLI
jgi:hypothetical protein